MINIEIQRQLDTERLKKAVEGAQLKTISHAAAAIRLHAMASIDISDEPGPPGGPVHARPGGGGKKKKGIKGKMFGGKAGRSKKAVLYSADKYDAVIGFAYNLIGTAMAPHEHGTGRYRTRAYPKRPTMWLALQANAERYAAGWAGSVED